MCRVTRKMSDGVRRYDFQEDEESELDAIFWLSCIRCRVTLRMANARQSEPDVMRKEAAMNRDRLIQGLALKACIDL